MPILLPFEFSPLSREEFARLDFSVMSHVFSSHRALGCLADEAVFSWDIAARLLEAGFSVDREVPIKLSFDGFEAAVFLDLVVDRRVIYELKTARRLSPAHEAQLLNYLMLTDQRRGKLLNLRAPSVETRFANAPISSKERRRFAVHADNWKGGSDLGNWIEELVKDWGSGLSLTHYREAIFHYCGGESKVIRQVPMSRNGADLGAQRFHLIDETSAFKLTAFEEIGRHLRNHLRRLIDHSPLNRIHLINVARRSLTLATIQK